VPAAAGAAAAASAGFGASAAGFGASTLGGSAGFGGSCLLQAARATARRDATRREFFIKIPLSIEELLGLQKIRRVRPDSPPL
jgi:hypothetical protein